MTALTPLLLAVLVQAPPASLPYAIPAGWTGAVNPNTGLVSLMPQRLPYGRVCLITVFGAEPFPGTATDYHEEIVRRATGFARPLEPPLRDSVGAFLLTRVHQLMPNGVQFWVTVYTTRWGDWGQAFVMTANAPDVFGRFAPVADAMIAGIPVPQTTAATAAPTATPARGGAPPPCYRPNGIEFCPKPVVPDSPATAIAGAYIAAAARSGYNVGVGVRSTVRTEILLLFANGVAARVPLAKSGAIDDTYWAEGLATMDPRQPDSIGARSLGRWTERSGTISIRWQIGPPTTLTREGTKLKEEYTAWAPYPSVDGLQLEARYQRIEEYVTPSWIALHRDGTFEENGVNVTMGGETINPLFPERGSGRYEIRRWSLILRFSTGFVQSINLLLGDNRTAPPDILLNGYRYVRAPSR